jgi:hypothetical protein
MIFVENHYQFEPQDNGYNCKYLMLVIVDVVEPTLASDKINQRHTSY